MFITVIQDAPLPTPICHSIGIASRFSCHSSPSSVVRHSPFDRTPQCPFVNSLCIPSMCVCRLHAGLGMLGLYNRGKSQVQTMLIEKCGKTYRVGQGCTLRLNEFAQEAALCISLLCPPLYRNGKKQNVKSC